MVGSHRRDRNGNAVCGREGVASFPFDAVVGLQNAEVRADDGNIYFVFSGKIPKYPLVPWDPSITQADLDRMAAEPGIPFEEVKRRLGWN